MTATRLLLGSAFWLAVVSAAPAAPFCVDQEGVPLQCLYVDPNECRQEANRVGGRCAVNPGELKTPIGLGKYCIVEAVGVIACDYDDYSRCADEGAQRGTACVAATPPPQKVKPAVDPFALKRTY